MLAPDGLTRGQFLRAAGGAVAALEFGTHAVAAAARTSPAVAARAQAFRSRPDLRPPPVAVGGGATASAAANDGYAFLAPTPLGQAQVGPLIVDPAGEVIWFRPMGGGHWAMNFQVQEYRGEPVLTWWEGRVINPGYGQGEGVIFDSSYREVARVRAGNGRSADLHEFQLTPQCTALITCYPRTVRADLSSIGGPKNGQVQDSVIQEIDVESGRVLFEWRGLDHLKVSETYVGPGGLCDYLHANSIDVTPDGHLLVSARHTWTVYKLNRHTGRVMWRLGGKRSDFALGHGTRFSWQHDARMLSADEVTLFDDGAGAQRTEPDSRGIVLTLDHRQRRVRLTRAYHNPRPVLAWAMGSMQTLADGNVVIGWGTAPVMSEFTAAGAQLARMQMPPGRNSYRAFRLPWSGTPVTPPAVAARAAAGGTTVYASWNGATGVAGWEVAVGPSPAALTTVTVAPRHGFETAIVVPGAAGYAAVMALDAAGRRLASSRPIRLPG